MATVNYSVRIDADLKRQSEAIFGEFGMNLTTAITAFLKQSVRMGGLPFDARLSEPNRETVLALSEAEAIAADAAHPRYAVEDALAELKL